ncbi:MAG: vitamin B12 dependent methionine synthase [Deltaproteobacteria bacterium]|nr:vitamin B12 dependent methionine synthase [Deltaproteobacteria bacterium]MBW1863114.1 vitamin B12 dependent methionine synthase [Deltaproteobacteria bacterium]
METLENIDINLDLGEIGRQLHIEGEGDCSEVKRLVEIAQPLITGRAVYRVCYIDEKLEDAVTINGVRLTSRVLRKNLDNVGRVFPYAVTIGNQLEEKISECKDLLEKYYLDTIGNIALVKTRKCLEDRLQSGYAIDGMSFMGPGSLKDWPIEEQRNLFSILGDTEASIGVRLNESLLMIPRKSVSGIYFPTEITFYSCQLCHRERCEGRKARYNEKLAREYGIFK